MTDQQPPREDDIAGRLRAHEARVPVSAEPSLPVRTPRRWSIPAAAAAGGILLAAAIVVPNALQPTAEEPTPDASATPVGTESPTASPMPTVASPVESPTAPSPEATLMPAPTPTAQLAWERTAVFPTESGFSTVNDVVTFGDELVAVGISYDRPLPVFGPIPPHRAQMWTSQDGRSWHPVELGRQFENVELKHLLLRPDGTLLLMGTRGFLHEGSVASTEPATWTSTDARQWTSADTGLPDVPFQVVQGKQGYLAYISSLAMEGEETVWYSTDAESWDLVATYPDGHLSMGAGPEGFVVAATLADSNEYRVRASANGREWIQSTDLPPVAFPDVVPWGRDWVLLNDDNRDESRGLTWFSPDGLDWSQHGRIPLGSAETPDGQPCNEYIRDQFAAGPWLIVPTELSYPCSESGYEIHGTQYISLDGASWEPIPISVGEPGVSRSGSTLHAAITIGNSLVVVGEQDGAATFWLGDPG